MKYVNTRNFIKILRIKSLYKRAFPKEERKPFGIIIKMQKLGKSDIWFFEENGSFLGFATTINGEREILIDYFAVCQTERGKGNGRRMLKALIEHYSPRKIFLEIEIPYEGTSNYAERVRRKNFYLSVGLSEMGTRVKLFGVDMELMGNGVELDFDSYRDFYLKNYGKFAYDHIERI